VEFTEFGGVYMSPDGKVIFRERTDAVETLANTNTYTSRTNLSTNPSFETNASGWNGAQVGGVVRSTSFSFVGTASGSLTMSSTTDSNIAFRVQSIPETGTHIVSSYFYIPSGSTLAGRTVGISVEGGTASVTAGTSSPATLVAGQWVRASRPYTVNTAGTIVMVFRLSGTLSTAVGQAIYLDGVLVEKSATLGSYFDGNTNSVDPALQPASSWLGTKDNSQSQVTFLTSPIPAFNQTTGIAYKDLKFSFSDQLIFNAANFQRVGGVMQSHFDQGSIDTYFPHAITKRDLLHENDAATLDLAKAYVNSRKATDIRIDSMTLDLTTPNYTAGIQAALGLDFFSPVEITNIQPAGSTLTKTLQIFGVNHQITPSSWNTTFITGDPLIEGFIIGNGKYGIIGVNTL
jgi:hypothetical protein